MTTPSLMAHDKGNGGDGVIYGNKVYLFDLIENGVEKHPFFEKGVEPKKEILEALSDKFDERDYPVRLLAQKITEIEKYSKLNAYALMRTLLSLGWKVVNLDLVNIQDEDSVADLSKLKMAQLAVRRDNAVSINARYWRKNGRRPVLDEINKVALMLHEAAYALMPVFVKSEVSDEVKVACIKAYWAERVQTQCMKDHSPQSYSQSSKDAREFVGHIFTPNYGEKDGAFWGLLSVSRAQNILNSFPSRTEYNEDESLYRSTLRVTDYGEMFIYKDGFVYHYDGYQKYLGKDSLDETLKMLCSKPKDEYNFRGVSEYIFFDTQYAGGEARGFQLMPSISETTKKLGNHPAQCQKTLRDILTAQP